MNWSEKKRCWYKSDNNEQKCRIEASAVKTGRKENSEGRRNGEDEKMRDNIVAVWGKRTGGAHVETGHVGRRHCSCSHWDLPRCNSRRKPYRCKRHSWQCSHPRPQPTTQSRWSQCCSALKHWFSLCCFPLEAWKNFRQTNWTLRLCFENARLNPYWFNNKEMVISNFGEIWQQGIAYTSRGCRNQCLLTGQCRFQCMQTRSSI